MKLTLTEAPEFPVLPVDSIVQVTCTNIEEKYVDGKDGKEGWTKLEFTFSVDAVPSSIPDAGSLEGSKIWGNCSAKFTTHPDNKLRQWTVALLGGIELGEGFELDTDVLLNRKARAVISQYTKRNGQPQHQVGGLLPLVQAASAPTITAPVIQESAQPLVSVTGSAWADDEPPF